MPDRRRPVDSGIELAPRRAGADPFDGTPPLRYN